MYLLNILYILFVNQVCESFMNKNRECIVTRGCATEEECSDSTSATGYYDGQTLTVRYFIN